MMATSMTQANMASPTLNYDGDALDAGASTIFAIPNAPGWWTVRNVILALDHADRTASPASI